MLSWRAKRQVFYFGIFAAVVFVLVFGLIYFLRFSPTCFDNRQNQGEKEVDCGGPCEPCVSEAREPIVLWTRFFESKKAGFYDVAALVRNPNLKFKLKSFRYRFKIYDEKNVLINEREGEEFLNPGDDLLILERDLAASERTPSRANFEILSKNWAAVPKKELSVKVVDKKFSRDLFPRVEIVLENQSLFAVKDILLEVVLLDKDGNAYQVNKTIVDKIEGEAKESVVLSWGVQFDRPDRIEVYLQKQF